MTKNSLVAKISSMDNKRQEKLQKVSEKVGSIFKNIIFQHEHKFEKVNIGRPHIGLLFILGKNPNGISVNEIAEKLNVTAGAVTQIVDKLVDKKLVERKTDAKDKRGVKIKLTEFAKEKFKKFRGKYLNSIGTIFEKLSDHELDQLVNLLEKITIPKT